MCKYCLGRNRPSKSCIDTHGYWVQEIIYRPLMAFVVVIVLHTFIIDYVDMYKYRMIMCVATMPNMESNHFAAAILIISVLIFISGTQSVTGKALFTVTVYIHVHV